MKRNSFLPILLLFGVLLLLLQLTPDISTQPYRYSQFLDQLDSQKIESVTIKPSNNTINVKLKAGADQVKSYSTGYPDNTEKEIISELREQKVPIQVKDKSKSFLSSLAVIMIPLALFLFLWLFLMSRMQGGAGAKAMGFGKSRAKLMEDTDQKITFKDVAGSDEAVAELEEIKDFLTEPNRFLAVGAKVPKGVLLYGPPGTGKTLLARAVAGEANVPFFSISGSDFVEMFVGVGAARVRDTFEKAREAAPAIIFLDEIDAVGRHRGAGMGGGNDEREQTLNQLLVELDGFKGKDNVILIAATNRPDVLDPALLRPGRFDRQIAVDRPDRKGRHDILKVHAKGKPMDSTVDLDALAGQTPGFTGADLANLINEAALLTARHKETEISQRMLDEGIMRVIQGPEKHSRIMTVKERRLTAIHEMGHALVAHFTKNSDPVHKISIVPRGNALGYVVSLPSEDKFTVTEHELRDSMAMALGGRAAEEIIIGEATSGASSDLEKVTEIAKRMVMRYGMSSLGPRVFGKDSSQPFLGKDFANESDYSPEIASKIDKEIEIIITKADQEAKDIITDNKDLLEKLADILLRHETIEKDQFIRLIGGEDESTVF